MNQKELDENIDELDKRVDRLRALYEQYFLGIERIEPQVLRKDVERRLYVLRREQIRNTAVRFKFQQVLQRYTTYQTYWQRVARQIEEGTYRRDVMKTRGRLIAQRDEKRRQRVAAQGRLAPDVPEEGIDVDVDVDEGEVYGEGAFDLPPDVDATDDLPAEKTEPRIQVHELAAEVRALSHAVEEIDDVDEPPQLTFGAPKRPTPDVPSRPQPPPVASPSSAALGRIALKRIAAKSLRDTDAHTVPVAVEPFRPSPLPLSGSLAGPPASTTPSSGTAPEAVGPPPSRARTASVPPPGATPVAEPPAVPRRSPPPPPPPPSATAVDSTSGQRPVDAPPAKAPPAGRPPPPPPPAAFEPISGQRPVQPPPPKAPPTVRPPPSPSAFGSTTGQRPAGAAGLDPVLEAPVGRPSPPSAPGAAVGPAAGPRPASAPPPQPSPRASAKTLPGQPSPPESSPLGRQTQAPSGETDLRSLFLKRTKPAAPAPQPAPTSGPPAVPTKRKSRHSITQPKLAAPTSGRAAAPAPSAPTGSSISEERIRAIYDRYSAERRRNNEGEVHFDTVARSIRDMLPRLEEKAAGRRVDFEVVVKDGKTVLKPVAK